VTDNKRILSLDELLPAPASVMLRGKEYPVIARSVEVALQILQRREQLAEEATKATEDNPARLLELNMEIISMACPSIKPELKGLTLPMLMKLAEFVGGELGLSGEEEEGEESGEAEVG